MSCLGPVSLRGVRPSAKLGVIDFARMVGGKVDGRGLCHGGVILSQDKHRVGVVGKVVL